VAARRHPSLRRCGKLASGAAAVALLLAFAPAATSLPVDMTPPSISYVIDGTAGTNNWYRGSTHGNFVVLKWTVADPGSTVTSTTGCEAAISIPGPNTGTTRTCTATSDGGTTSVTTKTIKIDADPPGVAAMAARPADVNGWYNHSVGLSWSGSDVTSGIAFCTSKTYSGPDSAAAASTGTCTDKAGNTSAAVTLPLKYDGTAPAVTPATGRRPDSNGWYNHPVDISWSGTDATSGVASCSPKVTYRGPDSGAAAPSGSCTDKAGNAASASLPLAYDATAPTVTVSAARIPDSRGWYNHGVGVSWSGTDASSGIAACSTAITYSGPD
jgi:hypothetical protein